MEEIWDLNERMYDGMDENRAGRVSTSNEERGELDLDKKDKQKG
jgi:hypothetical protein